MGEEKSKKRGLSFADKETRRKVGRLGGKAYHKTRGPKRKEKPERA